MERHQERHKVLDRKFHREDTNVNPIMTGDPQKVLAPDQSGAKSSSTVQRCPNLGNGSFMDPEFGAHTSNRSPHRSNRTPFQLYPPSVGPTLSSSQSQQNYPPFSFFTVPQNRSRTEIPVNETSRSQCHHNSAQTPRTHLESIAWNDLAMADTFAAWLSREIQFDPWAPARLE